MIKNSAAKQEMKVQSLGQEDPLEEEMAMHSSTLGWNIPRTGESGRPQSIGSQRVRHNLTTKQQQQQCLSVIIKSDEILSKH